MVRLIMMVFVLSLASAGAQASLLGRAPLTPGGTDYQAYFDDVLKITWLADANLPATEAFGLTRSGGVIPGPGEVGSGGRMDWDTANNWIVAINAASYLNVSNWRLPSVVDTGASGCDFGYTGTDCGYNVSLASGEMAHLFYSTLGNSGRYDIGGVLSGCSHPSDPSPGCLSSTGPFSNLQPVDYRSGTEYAPDTDFAWLFYFNVGYQDYGLKIYDDYYVWAIHDGDPFAPIPIPPAAWLFGSALGLVGVVQRRRDI